MKKTITILLTLIVGITFFCCEEDPTGSNGDDSQFMFVYANHNNYYWDDNYENRIYVDNTSASCIIHGNPFPDFTYFKLGETKFSGDDYLDIYPGYLSINGYENDLRITSNLNPLDVEVKTSFGTVIGNISLPDTITTLGLSETSNLPLGSPITVSWSGSNADFYSVTINYEWSQNDNYHSEYLDKFVSGNSVTYDGTIFSYNGVIDYIRVQPMNGPIPEKGSESNMSGDGSGFLYYMVKTIYNEGDDIIVGSGNGRLGRYSTNEPNEQADQERIREKIENRILGNQ